MSVKGVQPVGWTSHLATVKFQRAMADQQRKRLAEQIKGRRKDRGWSAEELAYRAGVSSQTISRLERGKIRDPRRATIRKVAAAFKLRPEQLLPRQPSFADAQASEEERLERIERRLGEVLAFLTSQPLEDFFPAQPDAAQGGKGARKPPRETRRKRKAAGEDHAETQ